MSRGSAPFCTLLPLCQSPPLTPPLSATPLLRHSLPHSPPLTPPLTLPLRYSATHSANLRHSLRHSSRRSPPLTPLRTGPLSPPSYGRWKLRNVERRMGKGREGNLVTWVWNTGGGQSLSCHLFNKIGREVAWIFL